MVNKINLPKNVEFILNRLHEYDYEAYIVGGCVRDSLLGLEPHDWDICTSALPEETYEVFSDYRIIPTGLEHGTVTIVVEDELYEVTTFRTDGNYSDGRHPDKVVFVSNLEHDLARRDFTINAIAYNSRVRFVDPFNGITDLHKNILRCVGNPYARFNEDALRIMRAIRFAANYDLTIDEKTSQAAKELAPTLSKISKERITSELLKLFFKAKEPGKYLQEYKDIVFAIVPELKITDGFEQNNPWHEYDVYKHITTCVDKVPQRFDTETLAIIRFAALLHDIGKPATYTEDDNKIGHFHGHAKVSTHIASEVLKNDFRLPTKVIQTILTLIENHASRIEDTSKSVRLWISKIGAENLDYLLALREADCSSYGNSQKKLEREASLEKTRLTKKILDTIDLTKECTKVLDLAINGNDLIKLGYSGKEIGIILNSLLVDVIEDRVINDHQALIQYIQKLS